MQKLLIAVSLVVLASFSSTKVYAQNSENSGDMRCILQLYMLSGVSADENAKRSLNTISYYYLGKINAREPGADLYKLTKQIRPTISKQEMAEGVRECTAAFQKRTSEISVIAKALQEMGN